MNGSSRRAPRAPSSNVRRTRLGFFRRTRSGSVRQPRLGAGAVLLAVVAGWLALGIGVAEAHPEVIGAEPPSGSVLSRTPARVRIVFSESVEPSGAEVLLVASGGEPVARGGNTSPASLELTPPPLGAGVYEVRYHALGRDGHPVTGAYRLAVWPPGTPRPAGLDSVTRASSSSGPGPQGRARGIAIALTVPLAGILLASAVPGVSGSGGSRLRRISASAVAAAIVAADALAMASAGRGVVATTFGRLVIVHAVLALGAGALAFLPGRVGRGLHAAWGGLLLVPVAATGHNVALGAVPALAGALDWVHLTAGSLWVGGVALVLTPGHGDPDWREQVRRFTPVAVGSAVVVVLTGAVQAAARVHRVRALEDTAYGRTLSLKILLVLAVAAFGLAAAWARRTRLATASRRVLAGEAAVFACVLASVAVLVSLPPPAPPPPPSSGPLLTTALVGDRLLSVLVTPYRPGANVVRVAPASSGDAATPVDAPASAWADAGGAGGQSGAPPLISMVTAGVRRPLTPAPSWEAPLQIPPQGATRLRVAFGEQAWERTLNPQAGTAIRIGSVVSLSGVGAEECRSRLVGQLVAVEEADVGRRGTPFTLEAVDAGEGGREAESSLRSQGAAALAGTCAGARTDSRRVTDRVGIPSPGDPLARAADPAAAGRVFASFLGQHGVKHAALVVDGGDSARKMATAFAAQGSAMGLEAVAIPAAAPSAARDAEAVVVAAGWEASRAVLATARDQGWTPERGIFLAPWLLHADILEAAVGGPTQVSVGLSVNPVSDGARRYLGALSALAPTEPPTVEGLAGYLEARAAMAAAEDPRAGPAAVRRLAASAAFPSGSGGAGSARGDDARIQFYTPTDVAILPAFLDHGSAAHAWLGDAGLAPVSGVLAASRR